MKLQIFDENQEKMNEMEVAGQGHYTMMVTDLIADTEYHNWSVRYVDDDYTLESELFGFSTFPPGNCEFSDVQVQMDGTNAYVFGNYTLDYAVRDVVVRFSEDGTYDDYKELPCDCNENEFNTYNTPYDVQYPDECTFMVVVTDEFGEKFTYEGRIQ